MTQLEELIDYLQENGSITGMECIFLGIMNYRGRMADLRRLGYDIETRMEKKKNRKGKTVTFARYIYRGLAS